MARSVPRALRTLGAPRWAVRCWVLVPMTSCLALPVPVRLLGSHARMNGCAPPVAIVCGSGNQGITCALPVMEYAEYLRCDHERLVRAVMLSMDRRHQELYWCALGVLRCYLRRVRRRRRDYLAGAAARASRSARQSRTRSGNVGGIVCDGAKASCAAKISAAVDAAILGHDMAMQGRGFRAGEGLIQDTVEQTIASMGYVGRCRV